jgi:diguanylate cyclase (GGDEF)-like protein
VAKPAPPGHPLRLERLVETEHRAGVDLAWIVVFAVLACVVAIVFAVPDAVFERVADSSGLNTNGIIALLLVAPLGTTVFAHRRYRDAVGAQRELSHLSLHDALTGLPNRRHLREVLPEAFHHARRHHTRAAVFFIDLDGFKDVNDTYGHEVGDRLMAAVADRLERSLDGDRWVARYAGDEFVVIDPSPPTAEHAARFARELVDLIEVPFEVGQDRIAISASIGVAFGDAGDAPDDVLRDADTAMYDAKHGDERTAVFSDNMRGRLTPATAERRLHQALEQGEFRLHFQPIVALRSGRMVGVESLLRWDDPERGVVAPGDFLGALEDSGLIVPVGRWVFEEACRMAARWAGMSRAGDAPLRVTMNVSPRQLGQSDFVEELAEAISTAGVDPALIHLELTETALVTDARAAWTALSAAKDLGVGLALDDFGTGYSPLSHLRNFDLDLLKLDGSFVRNIGARTADDTIVRHVIALAHDLGIATLGEGVRGQQHVDRLLELGCELGQGNHFAEPLPATMIDGLLLRRQEVADASPVDLPAPPELDLGPDDGPTAGVVLPRLRKADVGSG